jgi:hypothetical protein
LGEGVLTRGLFLVAPPIPEFRVAILQKSRAFVRVTGLTMPFLSLPDESSLQMIRFASRFAGAS